MIMDLLGTSQIEYELGKKESRNYRFLKNAPIPSHVPRSHKVYNMLSTQIFPINNACYPGHLQ